MAARFLVQTVDVLGDQQVAVAAVLKFCDLPMGGIRSRIADHRPADQAAAPITLPCQQTGHELAMPNRLFAFPAAVAISIIGNARVSADARAGEDKKPGVAPYKLRKQFARLFGLM